MNPQYKLTSTNTLSFQNKYLKSNCFNSVKNNQHKSETEHIAFDFTNYKRNKEFSANKKLKKRRNYF